LGLKPVMRRVWAPVGKRPLARFKRGYKWTYLYGFVCPQTGQTFWLLLPSVAGYLWSAALAEFAAALGAGASKQIVLVIDQAGWHISDEVVVPDGLHLVFLPPYSPELQPSERLWSLSDEALANTHFGDLDALIEAQAERCRKLVELPDVIRAHTQFHWWPTLTKT
jgi:hypothetical protein